MLLVLRKKSEAAAMTRWGVRIAQATGKPLHILWVESGSGAPGDELDWQSREEAEGSEGDLRWSCVLESLLGCADVDIQFCWATCQSRHLTVLAVERKLSPELIVAGLTF